ncbi:hypothetical protein DCAR_0521484 [Daucus carota subsp. sativus]|uniref:GRF-type domain-containing protein n=1 Tax=Daucus carota subsp. sativus TaxID=79200 RepID=A0AAF0X5D9_DAUCS|nr:hypothetical protein DCAR_0521484 [Daucus carota subsp. sativus]
MSFCYCGRVAADRVAWTDANAGRRFKNCIGGTNGCRYFQWVDGPLCSRAQVVIPGLLRRLRDMEANYENQVLEAQKKENKKWRLRMCVICLVWLVLYVFSGSEKK